MPTNRQQRRHPDQHPPIPTGVVISWLWPEHGPEGMFTHSLMAMLAKNKVAHDAILHHGGYIDIGSGPRISASRTEVVDQFLKHPSGADWLLLVDADMSWQPHTLEHLLDVAHPKLRPIVGGLCFAGGKGLPPHPTMYVLRPEDDNPNVNKLVRVMDWPAGQLMSVDATGAAFLLVHRTVLVRMAEVFSRPYPWFAETFMGNGAQIGEDVTFCLRARNLGYEVIVHTGVEVGHGKLHYIDTEYFRWRHAQEVEKGRAEELGSETIVGRESVVGEAGPAEVAPIGAEAGAGVG